MNTPHETTDSIERSAYDSAISEEVNEKWEEQFSRLMSTKYGMHFEWYDFETMVNEVIDFIRTQRSLAYEEGHAKGFNDGQLYANKTMNL